MAAKYRVAVVGSTGRGNYGHGLDTAWRTVPQTEVVAVADDNADGRAAAARRLKVTQAFADYRKLLDTVKVDIVAIGPRWVDQHRDMAIAAAERGAHVFVEKPFCRTPAEADEIVAACKKKNVKLAIGHPTRYSPMIPAIRKLIADGALGEILELRGRGKEDRRGGGEDLWVLGAHIMDMILALRGLPEWCFADVRQQGKLLRKSHVRSGPEGIGPLAGDQVRAVFGMADGSQAHFASVRNRGGNPRRYALQIHGSKGILELVEGVLPPVRFLPDPSWSPGRSGKQWVSVSSAGIGKPEPLRGPRYQLRHQLAIEDLLEAIEQDRQPLCSAEEGRKIIEMITAVFASAKRRLPVSFPLEKRGNPLADWDDA